MAALQAFCACPLWLAAYVVLGLLGPLRADARELAPTACGSVQTHPVLGQRTRSLCLSSGSRVGERADSKL